jgi:hypothetical protein
MFDDAEAGDVNLTLANDDDMIQIEQECSTVWIPIKDAAAFADALKAYAEELAA